MKSYLALWFFFLFDQVFYDIKNKLELVVILILQLLYLSL